MLAIITLSLNWAMLRSASPCSDEKLQRGKSASTETNFPIFLMAEANFFRHHTLCRSAACTEAAPLGKRM